MMGLPKGYRYLKNLAIYPIKSLKESYIKDYCTDENGNRTEDLENRYDHAEKFVRECRIFCFDCPDFEVCKGKCWTGCHNRAEALKIIRA